MKKITLLAAAAAILTIAACSKSNDAVDTKEPAQVKTSQTEAKTTETKTKAIESKSLTEILSTQTDAHKARHQYRNPAETLTFFGIKPGMTVAEVLPGGGWYSKVLIPYLGSEGQLVGIDYSIPMWGEFGGFANAEFLEKKKTWAADWTKEASGWSDAETKISAFAFGSAPRDLKSQVDVIFLPRAIHHLHRWEKAYLAGALKDMDAILKPEGIIAVVAHRASEDQPDEWANGDNGYMKKSTIVAFMDDAGFELAGESEINANPKDQAKAENKDFVWRLPPSLATSADDPELKAKMVAIGETDRMTLKFRRKK